MPEAPDSFDRLKTFMAAIRRLESGSYEGNYGATGVETGTLGRALGAYQIMSANWASWARQAGIGGADWRDRRAQDTVAEFKFTEYFNRYRDWGLVAIAWFGGPGAANKAEKDFQSVAGRTDVLGTTIGQYVGLIDKYMANAPDGYKTQIRNRLPEDDLPPSGGSTNVSNPNFVLEDYLRSIGQDTGGDQGPQIPDMRSPLTTMLDALSNSIAGGQRVFPGSKTTSILDTTSGVPELSLDVAEKNQTTKDDEDA